MAASRALRVRGLRELNRAFALADATYQRDYHASLRKIAEPVRRDAERLAGDEVRNVHPGDDWAGMRVGITRRLVYVAPQKRGSKRGTKKRPNLAPLLMDRAMQPALDSGVGGVTAEFGLLLDHMASVWGRGG